MKTTTFLTFVGDNCGKAEEAINFYTSLFPNSEVISIKKFEQGEPGGAPDLVKHGIFTLNGTEYMISENNFDHAWAISPGVSIYVQSPSEEEIDRLFAGLSSNGQVMVPLDNYETGDFILGKKFGWCADKYGLSWQFFLTEE